MWLALRAAFGVQIGNPADLVDNLRAGGARNAHVLTCTLRLLRKLATSLSLALRAA